ncbi:MAG: glycosyltransferase [Gammaproteobacteria bacterium]|nr:glycosyltransferase [Gammaproteobacteria bacterium]
MKISFVIPAYNEAAWIERCLQNIRQAVDACQRESGNEFEVEYIVTDNNSTDDTAQRAEQAGALVVFEAVNQISRARNAGAQAASGDWLIFIDADSDLSAALLTDVLALIDAGKHVGCGSLMLMDDMPGLASWALRGWSFLSKQLNWAAGSFVVCRADVFAELGGFSEQLFVAEEIDFSRRIKKYGRQHQSKFVVLREHPLQTSNRKVGLYSEKELFGQMLRLVLRPRKAMRDKSALDVWYDGRR